ncbi:MAG: hypothetical protein EOO27_49875 [Comamonadaceae bacterium]|nr:MAG: hypothetical protein EOO27_49875 [Comamonadaceae bacterium]
MANGFTINKRGIEQFKRELERELNRKPVQMSIGYSPTGPRGVRAVGGSTSITNYNAPIINSSGSGARIAVTVNGDVDLSESADRSDCADLNSLISSLLEVLPQLGMSERAAADLESLAIEARAESESPIREDGKLQRIVKTLIGCLSPISSGAKSGLSDGTANVVSELMSGLSQFA